MATKDKAPAPPPEREEPGNGESWSESVGALLDEIKRRFPAVERKDARVVGEPALFALPKDIAELASFLKDNDVCSFNYCRSVTGVDKVDRFEVVYNLARIPGPGQAPDEDFETIGMVVVIDDREKPALPSLTQVWPGVGLQEREVYDLLGIVFEGHPDLRRILLDEAFVGHPLRKSYPLEGRWEDMEATDAYLDERQTRTMREEAGRDYRPEDVPPSFKR